MNGQITGVVLGAVLLAVAFFFYQTLGSLGFPDGHRTEMDRALAPFYGWLIGLSAGCGIYLVYLGLADVRLRELKIKAVAVIYVALAAISAAIRYVTSIGLDSGGGG